MARILLVDDYPDALEVWSLYLKMCGFDVVTASDGAEALDAAVHHRPDIAILDLEMPGMSGYELARRLRADATTSAIPLIAVSGHSQPSRIEEARKAGCDLVLTKPCDPDRLCLEIQQLLTGAGQKPGMPTVTGNRQDTSHRG
jgi:CheY-like chemotaxis protein